jgi:hypothetical protein
MWIRKDFEHPAMASETAGWFRRFNKGPAKADGLQLYSRIDHQTGGAALLLRVPELLQNEPDLLAVMKDWHPANDDAQDLGHWHAEI